MSKRSLPPGVVRRLAANRQRRAAEEALREAAALIWEESSMVTIKISFRLRSQGLKAVVAEVRSSPAEFGRLRGRVRWLLGPNPIRRRALQALKKLEELLPLAYPQPTAT
jgi:hypothetical protein